MQLFKDPLFTDCTFVSSDGVEFKLHRIVLAARSEVLKKMLIDDLKPNTPKVITLQEASYILRPMFNFIYCGIIEDSKFPDYKGILIAATKYLIEDLKNHCITHIKSMLNFENATELLIFADAHCAEIKIDFIKYIGK